MYRPQFVYGRTPPQFDDFDFVHYFDFTVVPLLNQPSFPAGALQHNIPLQLQTDWPFYCRGIQVKGGPAPTTIQGQAGSPANVQIRFKDPFSHDLSNDFVPVGLYVAPSVVESIFVPLPPNPFFLRSNPLTVVVEPEVRCPAGSVWWLSVRNQTTTTQDLTQLRIIFQGVKRRLNDELGGGCAS